MGLLEKRKTAIEEKFKNEMVEEGETLCKRKSVIIIVCILIVALSHQFVVSFMILEEGTIGHGKTGKSVTKARVTGIVSKRRHQEYSKCPSHS